MLTYYECLGNLSELVSNSVQQRAQSPQHEVLRAFFIWMRGKLACLSRQVKSPSRRSRVGLWVRPIYCDA